MAANIPGLIALAAFYMVILATGIWASRKAKQEEKKSNGTGTEVTLVAGRNLNTVVGIFTMTATWVGGGYILGTAASVYNPSQGLVWGLRPVQYVVNFLVAGIFFAKHMREKKYVTMLDPFQLKYGDTLTCIVMIPALIADVLWAACVMASLGGTMGIILDIQYFYSVCISAAVAIIYTLLGGMFSVAYTDVIQLVFIFISLWMCVPFLMVNPASTDITMTAFNGTFQAPWVGSLELEDLGLWLDDFLVMVQMQMFVTQRAYADFITWTPQTCLIFRVNRDDEFISGAISVMQRFWSQHIVPKLQELRDAQSLGGLAYQALYQRILSASSVRDAQVICFVAAGFSFIIGIPSILVGAVAASTDWNMTSYGSPSPYVRGEAGIILPLTLQHLTPNYISILGIGAVSAAVMSSMDSCLLASASLFTKNIYKTIIRKQASDRELQWVIKISVTVVGLVAVGLAFLGNNVLVFWILSTDVLYCVIFPQLICVLFVPVSNGYGAVGGCMLGLMMRLLSGEPLLHLPPAIHFPGCRLIDGVYVQHFPCKTLAMLISLCSTLLISYVTSLLFEKSLLPKRWNTVQSRIYAAEENGAEKEADDTMPVPSDQLLDTTC